LENILDFAFEQRRDLEGQRQAGIVFTGLKCIDRLAADVQEYRKKAPSFPGRGFFSMGVAYFDASE
jgi:hypothetical protein